MLLCYYILIIITKNTFNTSFNGSCERGYVDTMTEYILILISWNFLQLGCHAYVLLNSN